MFKNNNNNRGRQQAKRNLQRVMAPAAVPRLLSLEARMGRLRVSQANRRNPNPLYPLYKVESPSTPTLRGRQAPPLRERNRQTSVSAAYSTGQSTSAPIINANRDSSRIIHREFVTNVSGSALFTVLATLALNPGLSATFPWLSTQAQGWESYRFNSLRACYYTRTGSNIPGSVMLIPDYDAADGAPPTEAIASTFEDISEDAPWKDIVCNLRPAAMHALGPKKFIRSQALTANQDIKTYDVGNLFICTVDGTTVSWGKLWLEYDISLYTPQLPPSGGIPVALDHVLGFTPTTANAFGALAIIGNFVNFGGSSVVTFKVAGKFVLIYQAAATTDTQVAPPAVSASGALLQGVTVTGQLVAGSGTASLIQVTYLSAVVGTTVTYNNTVVAGTSFDFAAVILPSNAT